LNLLAISVNGGVMPASPSALAGAGLGADEPGFQNSTALAEPRPAFLGDVFYFPASWPLSNVFSVGDVLIALGGRVGAAPHLPVTPGPILDPPTLVSAVAKTAQHDRARSFV
jgi:hypothetical protein